MGVTECGRQCPTGRPNHSTIVRPPDSYNIGRSMEKCSTSMEVCGYFFFLTDRSFFRSMPQQCHSSAHTFMKKNFRPFKVLRQISHFVKLAPGGNPVSKIKPLKFHIGSLNPSILRRYLSDIRWWCFCFVFIFIFECLYSVVHLLTI